MSAMFARELDQLILTFDLLSDEFYPRINTNIEDNLLALISEKMICRMLLFYVLYLIYNT